MEKKLDEKIRELEKAGMIDNLIKEFKKLPVTEEFSLDTSVRNVISLIEFMELIKNNSSQLKNPINVEYTKKVSNPAAFLLDYIILEISTYYTRIYLMRKKGINYPEPPKYWEVLKNYRDLNPAHRDKEHQMKSLADYIGSVFELEKIGIPNIISDFLESYKQVKKQNLKTW